MRISSAKVQRVSRAGRSRVGRLGFGPNSRSCRGGRAFWGLGVKDLCAQTGRAGKQPVVAKLIEAWPRHQREQLGHEIERVIEDSVSSVVVAAFEAVAQPAVCGPRQPFARDGWAQNVPQESRQGFALAGGDTDPGVDVEPRDLRGPRLLPAQVLGNLQASHLWAPREKLSAARSQGDDPLHRLGTALGEERLLLWPRVGHLDALRGGGGGVPAQSTLLEQARGAANDVLRDGLQVEGGGRGQGVEHRWRPGVGFDVDAVEGGRVEMDTAAQITSGPLHRGQGCAVCLSHAGQGRGASWPGASARRTGLETTMLANCPVSSAS